MPPRSLVSLSTAVLAAVAVSVLVACGKQAPPPEPDRYVRTLVLSPQSAGQQREFAAEVRARVESRLSFRVPGKILERKVDLGSVVKPGQTLARIDSSDLVLAQEAAKASVLAARVLTASDNNSLKTKLLEGLVSSDILPATAWQEQAGTLDVTKITTQATPFEGGFRISGAKRFVIGATHADGYIVSANSPAGLQLLWVPRDAAGTKMEFDMLADGRQSGTLTLKDVTVPKENIVNSGAAAAKSLDMSYRRAWLLIDELNGWKRLVKSPRLRPT